MFISWAVTSYQSNDAECDFSQGISVCLIDPISDPLACPRSNIAETAPRNSHTSHFFFVSFNLVSFLLSPPVVSFRCYSRPVHPARSISFDLRVSPLTVLVITSPLYLVLLAPKFTFLPTCSFRKRSFGFNGANRYCVLSIMLFIARFCPELGNVN